jgi:hypothetical protein
MKKAMKAALGALGAAWLALGVWAAEAAAQGRGGGRVERLGENTADLLAEILGPVLIILVAVAGLYAFIKREIGIAVTAAAIAVFLGLFVFAPETAESLIKGFWQQIA